MKLSIEMQFVTTQGDEKRTYSFGHDLTPLELETALRSPLMFQEMSKEVARELARNFCNDVRFKKWPPPEPPWDTPEWARDKGI